MIRKLPYKKYVESNYFVAIDKTYSGQADVRCGVTQDSILRPSLFIPHIKVFNHSSDFIVLVMLADDILIYIFSTGNETQEFEYLINRELLNIGDWFRRCRLMINQLSLNVSKTSYPVFRKVEKVYMKI